MASKPSGTPAPYAVRTQRPVVEEEARLCTGATAKTGMDMTVIFDLVIGPEVSAAEADLYLHWASDLLAPAKDVDDDGKS